MKWKRVLNWIRNGNDCCKCKCAYEDWGAYHEDCNCGCLIKGTYYDEKRCYLIPPIRWLLMRRIRYFMDHQYDGIGEFYEELERENEKCRDAIMEMFSGKVVCIKSPDGTFHECDTEMLISNEAWRIRDALEPEFQKPPALLQRWKDLLCDTVMHIPNKVRPYVCK